MSKRRIYTQPITKRSLYWISMAAIYVVYTAMGGIAILIVFARIVLGEIPASEIGSIVLEDWPVAVILLITGFGLVQFRTRPAYRYYEKRGLDFPDCLKGKYLTCTDGETYLYCDDRWFVAATTLGASALCADVIDFSVPATMKVWSNRGNITHKYYFRTDDGKKICVRLGRQVEPFEQWVQAHGGSIE